MTDQQIIDNKLIAKFMNYEHNGKYITLTDKMCYDNDWNWLMPVVEKIETVEKKTFTVIITNNRCSVQNKQIFINNVHRSTKIMAIYKSVVNFIKWYNKQNSPNPHLDKEIDSMSKPRLEQHLARFKKVKREKLYDAVVTKETVQYSINLLKRKL